MPLTLRSETMDDSHDLKTLPLRAITALAARCARRMLPLFILKSEESRTAADLRIILRAVEFAEKIARGEPATRTGLSQAATEAGLGHFGVATFVAYAAGCCCHCAEWIDLAERFSSAPDQVVHFAREVLSTFRTHALSFGDNEKHTDPSQIDFDLLKSLNLGAYPAAGSPIDPSEAGPLGILWPEGSPSWHQEGITRSLRILS